MVAAKQFREDLFHRINVIPIRIPGLRERPEDIPILLRYFLNKYCTELNKELEFSNDAVNFLTNYEWTGNVRELQNVVLRAVHLASGKTIDISSLLIGGETNGIHTSLPSTENSLKQTIHHTERVMLKEALIKHGSARGAAKEVGLSHTTVLKKIRQYGLEYLQCRN
jgi:transcriptional regulator of aroF, aroG, tyrA and aromatic amino acid transport